MEPSLSLNLYGSGCPSIRCRHHRRGRCRSWSGHGGAAHIGDRANTQPGHHAVESLLAMSRLGMNQWIFSQLKRSIQKADSWIDIPIGLSWLLRLSWNISWVKAQDDTDIRMFLMRSLLPTLERIYYFACITYLIVQDHASKTMFFLTYCAWACVVHNTFRRTNWFLQAVVSAILAFSPDISLASFFWGLHQKVA